MSISKALENESDVKSSLKTSLSFLLFILLDLLLVFASPGVTYLDDAGNNWRIGTF